MNHHYTEKMEINFSKLEERLWQINNPVLGKYNDIGKMIYDLNKDGGATLIMATGGSKIVAYYLQMIIERLGTTGIICEVIEPRDYFYKTNKNKFSNLVVISASGNTNGIDYSFQNFKGHKYLLSEQPKIGNFNSVSWGTSLYDKEKSFISLATSLGPMSLLLDITHSLKLNSFEVEKINQKNKILINKSLMKIKNTNMNFNEISLFQIISGYDTRVSSNVIESNIIESGLGSVVIHDKGSFCHGRSNLLYQYPNSAIIYLLHDLKQFDKLLLDSISSEYSNILIFDTIDLNENIYWKEYYLSLLMYFLSKKISEDKKQDLTQPEYNYNLVKKLYKFRGEM